MIELPTPSLVFSLKTGFQRFLDYETDLVLKDATVITKYIRYNLSLMTLHIAWFIFRQSPV